MYEHLIFDGGRHVPIATLPGMRERTVTISSAGKTFSVTGWKIGWACAPPRLLDRGPHGQAVPHLRQRCAVPAGRRRGAGRCGAARAASGAAGTARPAVRRSRRPRLRRHPCRQATYFATVDVGGDAVEFCRELPHTAGVVAIPSSVFYDSPAGDRYVRFAFCKRPEVLAEALRRLKVVAR